MSNISVLLKKLFLALIAAAMVSPLMAQGKNSQKLIPFEVNDKWGYLNNKGKVVIAPQFNEADRFYEGLAAVQVGDKYGFIDEKGKFVIEPQFGNAYEFSEGLAPVAREKDGLWEYIDYQGKTVIEAQYTHAREFSEGLASVMIGSAEDDSIRKGYIDKTGKFAIEPQFGWSEPFSNGLAMIAKLERESTLVQLYDSKAFIDKSGNRITPFYTSAGNFREGLACVKIENLWGFINTSGSLVIPAQFDYANEFSEGVAAYGCGTQGNRTYGFINKKGERLTDCVFLEYKDFQEGLALVKAENKLWGYIDTKGRFAIKPRLIDAGRFYNELAEAIVINDRGIAEEVYINYKGEVVVTLAKIKESLR